MVGILLLFAPIVSGAEGIPNVSPEMARAGYWIRQLPDPDKVLLTLPQIKKRNQKFLRAEPTAIDPLVFPEWVHPSILLVPLEKEEHSLLGKVLYDGRGRRVGKTFIETLKESCALTNIPDLIPVRFALVVKECPVRTFPTMELLVEEPGKFAFDLLQQTTLHPGEPVAILWESGDRQWYYLASPLLRGWVQKKFLGLFHDKKEFVAYAQWPEVIVIERSVPFYGSPAGKPLGEWKMGAILHSASIEEEAEFYRIDRPLRDDSGKIIFSPVYVKKEMMEKEFLPLTRRTILTQAFKLYGAPYGWGGLKGGWDCSSFLRDVFLTMGVTLPRNSGPQSRIGELLANFPNKEKEEKKREFLDQALPAATFVKLDNHIMLYLGKVNGRYYVIHATAGYRKPGGLVRKVARKDKVVNTFRVLVSDVELGKGGRRGSLLERMISLNAPFGG